jgi:hypothetical protein
MRTTRAVPVPEGRTRWRRFTLATTIVTAMAAGLVYLAATGAMAVSLQLSGIPFKLSASNMSGDGFVQYAKPDKVTNGSAGAFLPANASQKGSDGETYVATTVTKLDSAEITNLHQTVCAPIPSLLSVLAKKNLLVTIDAGRSAGNPATASGLLVDAPLMNAGAATFTNIQIGADLGLALGTDANGNFAQQASHVSIDNLDQLAIGTSAGQFKLTGLGLGATFVEQCP